MVYEKELFVYQKAFKFSKRIIKLYKYLIENKKEYVISQQLLKSGTSIGANIKEAKYAQSNKDFIHKLQISLKEANESEYWIELLKNEFISEKEADNLLVDLREILKILITSINSVKNT